ncbi:MAG: iron-containing alcohol dehydrogenase [Deltaproteobacteria bacterium]|nr:iron-containing alcohol dehydrogenase [Deltaproteobacteria bacterium]
MLDRITLFRTTKRIVFGIGAVEKIGAEIQLLKGKKVLIVTDPGIRKAGLLEALTGPLQSAGIPFALFDEVEPDPRIEVVELCAEKARAEGVDCLIGYGGGSSLDIAKVAAVRLTNSGAIESLFGIDLIGSPGLPVILIPTTAGTGSEVTPIAILSDTREKLKKGIVSPYLFPETALLDPRLTVGLPPAVTALTGMDALIHAIEAYTSVNAFDLTDHLAYRAVELISANLRTAYARGEDLEARSKMLEGSLLAGIAFANAGVTAVHAFAYPIGGEFHVAHGLANSVMLPAVMRFNLLGNLAKFADMAQALGVEVEGLSDKEAALEGLEAVEDLLGDLQIPRRLRDLDIPREAIPALAEGVMKVTRLLANNPRRLTLEDARRIYEEAW